MAQAHRVTALLAMLVPVLTRTHYQVDRRARVEQRPCCHCWVFLQHAKLASDAMHNLSLSSRNAPLFPPKTAPAPRPTGVAQPHVARLSWARRWARSTVVDARSNPVKSLPDSSLRNSGPGRAGGLFSFAFAPYFVPSEWISIPSELGWRTDFTQVYTINLSCCLGQGSWGKVHLAVDKQSGELGHTGLPAANYSQPVLTGCCQTGQEVAVKTLSKVRPKFTRSKTLDKIRREQQMLQRLQSCSSVVQLLASFEEPDAVHLVQELCRGGDLRKLVEAHGPLDEACTASVALQALQVIHSCHDQGILYGDVKPANFCLVEPVSWSALSAPSLHIKAVDFGNAVSCGESLRLTKRRGTLTFLAPEVYSSNYSLKADMWSLGVTLYWLYSRHYPFWPTSDPPAAASVTDMEQLVGSTPIVYSCGPWLTMSPEGLDFVSRCLQRDERLRLSAAEALQHPWIQAARLQASAAAACSATSTCG